MAEIDIAPELQERILRLYRSGLISNPAVKRLIDKELKDYSDAQKYAILVGKNTSRALLAVLKPEILPNGKLYFNIADRTVRPALEACYKTVVDFCEDVQKAENEAAMIGIKSIKPVLSNDRVKGIIDRLSETEEFKDIEWILKAPVVNFSQSVVDDSVQVNAKFQNDAGLKPKLVRTTTSKCCEWCDNLVGSYEYSDAPEDIFRRHDNCNCVVNFIPAGGGKKQNVWSKRWS